MASSNTIFTGNSTYSSDFQQIIDRSVAIASLPLSQLNNQKTALTSQSTELSTVSSKFSALQAAIDTLNNASGANSFAATSSDSTVARVSVGDTSFVGDINLQVISLGARTNALSLDTLPRVSDPYTDSITSSPSLTMTIGTSVYTIPPGTGTLASLVDAINSAGAGVRASIINLGTSSAPDYRVSVQSTGLGDVTIQLNDGSQDLLSTISHGSPATYKVNGQPSTPIESDSRTVTLSPGLTADLLKIGTTDITISRSTAAISNALSAFVSAYNSAVTELDTNRGGGGGALSGQSLVYTLSQTLRQLSGYGGSGSVSSLEDLGISFDKEGKLGFDSSTFADASQDINGVLSFLGASGQSGFLKSAGELLTSAADGSDGFISHALESVNNQLVDQNKRIDDTQGRIDLLRDRLTAQISAADAVIAQLQQQVIFFNGLFDAYSKSNSK